jgi:hypothetical protein
MLKEEPSSDGQGEGKQDTREERLNWKGKGRVMNEKKRMEGDFGEGWGGEGKEGRWEGGDDRWIGILGGKKDGARLIPKIAMFT